VTTIKSKILGTGIYLPKNIVTNHDMAKIVDTNDEWISSRTGIKQRHICDPNGGEFPTDMAYHATQDALKAAGLVANDIDMIIFASVTPDYPLPNSACILQQKLGITNQCAAMDIAVACSGFVYGVNMANSFIKTGLARNVLCIGSEMLSRVVNWKDRTSCVLFGDGCGVAIVGRNEDPTDTSDIIASYLGADGSGKDYFWQHIGGAVTPLTNEHILAGTHFMNMKGGEMFKVATRTLANNAKIVMDQAKLNPEQIDWLVPHQANIRIIDTTVSMLNFDPKKVIINIEKYGNTSAATVPIAFHEAITDGRIKRDDIVMFDAFGAGLTTGATILRF
jgi:3-oxoacyl-[acyl-carrier-protein] synthase-3